MTEIHRLGAAAIARAVRGGELSAVDVARHYRDRIDARDGALHCYLSLRDDVEEQARTVEARVAKGDDDLPLAGVPVALKDNIAVAGGETTCGSEILAGHRSVYDATVVERLLDAGAVILGKTNLDEFAMGSSTENSAFGPTRNPWDTERTPGGSSGGSAAAIAAGLASVAFGSDTGGSIRQPASFCSVSGLKPTYGRVSRFGLVAFGSSLDQIGPFAASAADAALALDVVAGHDPKDSTSSRGDHAAAADSLTGDVAGLRIGVPREYMDEGIDDAVRAVIEGSLDVLRDAGAEVVEVSLPHTSFAIPVYYIVATSEASSNLARYDGAHYGHRAEGVDDIISMFEKSRTEGFGDEVTRRIILGTWSLSSGYYDAYYDRALRVRSLIRKDFDDALAEVDVLAGPTSPILPFRFGEKVDDPLSMYLADVLTAPLNLAGHPGISIPAGFADDDGTRLPVGLQLIAGRHREDALMRTADAFQRRTSHHQEVPA